MQCVVGFMGRDWQVGRTFLCENKLEIQTALEILLEENQETKENARDIVQEIVAFDYTSSDGAAGTYFVGGLEKI